MATGYRGAGDHFGRVVRAVSTTTRNFPDQGVGSRFFGNTQNVLPPAIAFS
jgi:hypothetical protein